MCAAHLRAPIHQQNINVYPSVLMKPHSTSPPTPGDFVRVSGVGRALVPAIATNQCRLQHPERQAWLSPNSKTSMAPSASNYFALILNNIIIITGATLAEGKLLAEAKTGCEWQAWVLSWR